MCLEKVVLETKDQFSIVKSVELFIEVDVDDQRYGRQCQQRGPTTTPINVFLRGVLTKGGSVTGLASRQGWLMYVNFHRCVTTRVGRRAPSCSRLLDDQTQLHSPRCGRRVRRHSAAAGIRWSDSYSRRGVAGSYGTTKYHELNNS